MSANACTVVFYHYVRDPERTAFPAIKARRVADFAAQINWLARQYDIVDYATFARALAAGRPLARAALLTFDDGFQDHYMNVLPVLLARRVTGVFFLIGATLGGSPRLLNVHKTHFLLARLGSGRFAAEVGRELERIADLSGPALAHRPEVYRYDGHHEVKAKHVLNYELPFDVADRVLDDLFRTHVGDPDEFAAGLYLTPEMIGEMAEAGMTFGFHSESHRVLSRLAEDAQRGELAAGVRRISMLTGQRSVPFCYPYGHRHTYNTETLAILGETGYSMAFNTARRATDVASDGRFELPRFDTRDLPIAAGEQVDA